MVTVYGLWDRFADYVVDCVIRRDLDNIGRQPDNQVFVYHCKKDLGQDKIVDSGLENKILKFPDLSKDDGPFAA